MKYMGGRATKYPIKSLVVMNYKAKMQYKSKPKIAEYSNAVILRLVLGKSEARKEDVFLIRPLRTGAFDNAIAQNNKLERHFVDAVDEI